MGEFGRRRIETDLGWEHSADKLLAAYEKAFSKVRRNQLLEAVDPDAPRNR